MIQKLRKKFSGGFTLLEVLICVAIIAILASVFIPTFIAYKHRNDTEQAKQEVIVEKSKPEIEKPKPEPGLKEDNEVFKKL